MMALVRSGEELLSLKTHKSSKVTKCFVFVWCAVSSQKLPFKYAKKKKKKKFRTRMNREHKSLVCKMRLIIIRLNLC